VRPTDLLTVVIVLIHTEALARCLGVANETGNRLERFPIFS